jgi:hypothetical protein
MSLGSYRVAMARREQAARRRFLMAATSIALVAIVGASALYVAATPARHSDQPDPAAALAAASTASPAIEAPEATSERAVLAATVDLPAADLDGTTVGREEASDPIVPEVDPSTGLARDPASDDAEGVLSRPGPGAEPESRSGAEPGSGARPAPGAESDTVTADDPSAEPARDAEVAPGSGSGQDTEQPGTITRDPRSPETVVRRNGWVCQGQLQLEDPRGRDWSFTRAAFREGEGYERVILYLDRLGFGAGDPASLTVEAFPTERVSRLVPGVRPPAAGRSTVVVHLADGFRNNLGLRGYRPSGLRTIKEFSVFPAGRSSARVLISTTADGCFRVRVPAWTGTAKTRKAQVYIDLKS